MYATNNFFNPNWLVGKVINSVKESYNKKA